MSDQYAAPSAAKGSRWFVAGLSFLVILAVAAGITLSRMRDADARAAAGSPSAPGSVPAVSLPPASVPLASLPSDSDPSDSASSTLVPSAEGLHQGDSGAEPGRGTPKVAPSARRVSSSASPAPAGPVVVHFRVATEPACPSGTDQVRYEGRPVVLEWKVTGADRTTLSVDGPGLYAEYGTTGSAKVNFPCGGEPGALQSHTYTLTAFDGDRTRSKTLTVTAKIQEIAAT